MRNVRSIASTGLLVALSVGAAACPAARKMMELDEVDAERVDGPGSANHDLDASGKELLPGVDLVADAGDGTKLTTLAPKIYVANSGSNDVTVIDGASMDVVGDVRVEGSPRDIRGGGLAPGLFVGVIGGKEPAESSLVVIDPATGKVGGALTLAAAPDQLALSADGHHVYVASTKSPNLEVVDATEKKVEAPFEVGHKFDAVAASPDGNWLYLVEEAGRVVDAVDLKTKSVVQHVKGFPGQVRAAAFSADSTRAYLSTSGKSPALVVVSLPDHKVANVVKTTVDGARPLAVVPSPDGKRVYVTDEGGHLLVLDAARNEWIGAVNVGSDPRAIAVSADGRTAYVADMGSDEVSVVDTQAMVEKKRIKVGHAPIGIAIVTQPS